MPEDFLVSWLRRKLEFYGDGNPEIIGYVSPRSRVFVPGMRRTTVPEPDLAVYDRLPDNTPLSELNWRNVSPILVVEVMRAADPYKDLVRNVELYLQVSTIREYWILDARELADEPTLLVYRRRGKQWQKPREIGYRESYTTPLLPGFKLVVDPRR
jgi:Uma2 family endonuclease